MVTWGIESILIWLLDECFAGGGCVKVCVMSDWSCLGRVREGLMSETQGQNDGGYEYNHVDWLV